MIDVVHWKTFLRNIAFLPFTFSQKCGYFILFIYLHHLFIFVWQSVWDRKFCTEYFPLMLDTSLDKVLEFVVTFCPLLKYVFYYLFYYIIHSIFTKSWTTFTSFLALSLSSLRASRCNHKQKLQLDNRRKTQSFSIEHFLSSSGCYETSLRTFHQTMSTSKTTFWRWYT